MEKKRPQVITFRGGLCQARPHPKKRKRGEPFPSRKVTETTGPAISKRSKEAPESAH